MAHTLTGGSGFTGADAPRPQYQTPSIRVMDESEVLIAFQMSAARIGAAGCWWAACNSSPVEENT
jgi:hypothetical protein